MSNFIVCSVCRGTGVLFYTSKSKWAACSECLGSGKGIIDPIPWSEVSDWSEMR